MWGWILVGVVVIAAIVTGLVATGAPANETASVVFPLFLVALIAAGVRAILRQPHA